LRCQPPKFAASKTVTKIPWFRERFVVLGERKMERDGEGKRERGREGGEKRRDPEKREAGANILIYRSLRD